MEGLYIPAVTPFENEEVSYNKIEKNLELWNKLEISGYLVLGSTGEFPHVTVQEKIRIISTFKENLGDKELIVQTGMPSLKETIKLANVTAELGADKVLILSNFYFKNRLSEEAILDFYRSAADSIRIPVMVYNMPGFTGINISSDIIVELSGHENIIGIKDSSGNLQQLEEIIKGKKKEFYVFSGSAQNFYNSLELGADGGIYAAANIIPEFFLKLFIEYKKGNFAEAQRVQNLVFELCETIQKKYSINGIKAGMNLRGYFGGDTRKPLFKLSEEEFNGLKPIINKLMK